MALLDTFVTPGSTFLANPTPGSALCDNIVLGKASITVIDYNISYMHYGKQIIYGDHSVECARKYWYPTGFLGVYYTVCFDYFVPSPHGGGVRAQRVHRASH